MDFAAARANMVDCQLRTNKVREPRLIGAFEAVPRELFVPEPRRSLAYIDEDLEIAPGRYLIEPMVLARLLQAAEVTPDDLVLEVGSASGYATAILSRLAATVVALEEVPDLAAAAAAARERLDIDNVVAVAGPLAAGYPDQAPYNVILINGAVEEVPDAITEQLAGGGRLVTVRLDAAGLGHALLFERSGAVVSSRELFDAAIPCLPGFQRARGFVF